LGRKKYLNPLDGDLGKRGGLFGRPDAELMGREEKTKKRKKKGGETELKMGNGPHDR